MCEMDTRQTIAQRAALAGASSISSKVTYGASGATVFFGMNLEVATAVVGIAIALLSFFANMYYQRKKHNLDVLLAQAQLEKIATATVDESQKVLIDKIRTELVKEFGNANQRKNGDRRVWNDPNYKGVERRKGTRRKSISGDTDAARALRTVTEVTKSALDELENGANKHS